MSQEVLEERKPLPTKKGETSLEPTRRSKRMTSKKPCYRLPSPTDNTSSRGKSVEPSKAVRVEEVVVLKIYVLELGSTNEKMIDA